MSRIVVWTKSLLREMSQTVEDIEDARTIERAKRANGSKPRIPWAQVKKELQLEDEVLSPAARRDALADEF